MGKVTDTLKYQLTTEYKQDAEDCIKICDKLKEIDGGNVWSSKWNLLIDTTFKGFPSDKRRYKPSNIGAIFLKGIKT